MSGVSRVSISLMAAISDHQSGVVRSLLREQDGLPTDREVAALRVALVVLRHEDAAEVVVAVEDDAEHVEDLALLVVGRRPLGRHARDVRRVERHARAHGDAIDLVHVEQLVVHAEARLLREVVDAVDGGEEGVALALEVLQRRRHGGGGDQQRGVVAEEDGAEHGVLVGVAQLLRDQLQSGGVGHQGAAPMLPPGTLMRWTAPGSSRSRSATTSSVPTPP